MARRLDGNAQIPIDAIHKSAQRGKGKLAGGGMMGRHVVEGIDPCGDQSLIGG